MKIGARLYSEVKVENAPEAILVPVSTDKPDIPDTMHKKWHQSISLAGNILCVSAVIITRFSETNCAIFVTEEHDGNPFRTNDTATLGSGLFCETVAGRKTPLVIPDIGVSPHWKSSPFAAHGMHSYYGVPLHWEDGELFGTLCILDVKTDAFPPITPELLDNIKEIIESDLKHLTLQEMLSEQLSAKELLIREAHHRINNHFTLLISYIQLQVSDGTDRRRVQDILLDIQNRIRSISVIHEELCSATRNREHPPLDIYIDHLCKSLVATLSGITISMNCTIAPLELPVEQSVSIGLIIAELVTNSIKYAFAETPSPEIVIAIARVAPKRISMFYKDNGRGLPADFEKRRGSTLGINLITRQVEQLHGEMRITGDNGVTFRLTIDG